MAVSTPFSPIPSAEKAPVSWFTWKARAVPMPCAATPVAKPRTLSSRTPSRSSTPEALTPMMPVSITSTAVSEGRPPIFSATPMAMGMVTDLGASDSSVCGEAPSSQPMPTADTTAINEPANRPPSSGSTWVRSWAVAGRAVPPAPP